jgi:hypothetical protein
MSAKGRRKEKNKQVVLSCLIKKLLQVYEFWSPNNM